MYRYSNAFILFCYCYDGIAVADSEFLRRWGHVKVKYLPEYSVILGVNLKFYTIFIFLICFEKGEGLYIHRRIAQGKSQMKVWHLKQWLYSHARKDCLRDLLHYHKKLKVNFISIAIQGNTLVTVNIQNFTTLLIFDFFSY